MSIKIDIPPIFFQYTDKKKVVEVTNCRTIADCLTQLTKQYPPVKAKLLNKDDKLSPYIRIYLNGKILPYTDMLSQPVNDGDGLKLYFFAAGG